MISDVQMLKFSNTTLSLAPTVSKWFNQFNVKYEVDTDLRIAAFLAQLIHESGGFRYTREIASGAAYEGRHDLGNIYPGDGKRYKGHGYMQITGRTNHALCSKDLFGTEKTLLDNPELLCTPQYAMESSFWFWNTKNLNPLADKQWMETITKRINGGLNGFENRVRIYNIICANLGLPIYKIAA